MNTKNGYKVCLLVILLLLISISPVFADSTKFRIVYVSKMPEIDTTSDDIGGLPELGTLLKESRKLYQHVLFLHGGDSLAPSAMSSFDFGSHMIDILNSLEPTVMAINEREFSYKEDELLLRIAESAFPFISANIYDPVSGGNLYGVEDSLNIDIDGFNIGIFSILNEAVHESFLPDRIQVSNSASAIINTARNLQNNGTDFLILLTGHILPETEDLLNDKTVDMIFEANSTIDSILIVNSGFYGIQGSGKGNALVVDVELMRNDNEVIAKFSTSIESLKDYKPDPLISEQIEYYNSILSEIMDITIGVTETSMNTTKNAVRTEENAFGNLVADAMRNYYDSDIALVNGGSIRGNKIYEAGSELTRKDILKELPFRNKSTLISVSGSQLKSVLENSVSLVENVKGRFLQVSGINVSYCPDNPPGSRIQSIIYKGKPISPEKMYSLAISEFLYKGGDGYDMLKQSSLVRTSRRSLLVWEITRLYIESLTRVSPEIEGRILIVCTN